MSLKSPVYTKSVQIINESNLEYNVQFTCKSQSNCSNSISTVSAKKSETFTFTYQTGTSDSVNPIESLTLTPVSSSSCPVYHTYSISNTIITFCPKAEITIYVVTIKSDGTILCTNSTLLSTIKNSSTKNHFDRGSSWREMVVHSTELEGGRMTILSEE